MVASIEDRQHLYTALTALAEVTAPAVAGPLLATALRSMPWDDGLHVLARLAPEAVQAIAREVLRDYARAYAGQAPAADE